MSKDDVDDDDDELVTDLLRENWCNGFWPYVSLVIIHVRYTSASQRSAYLTAGIVNTQTCGK